MEDGRWKMEDVRSKMEELLSHTFKALRHEPELQDQQALNASPIRDIILKSWEEEQKMKCFSSGRQRTNTD